MMINGVVTFGPDRKTTTCQLHMRSFKDGDEIYIEPWRAKAFPVIKDLMVSRQLSTISSNLVATCRFQPVVFQMLMRS